MIIVGKSMLIKRERGRMASPQAYTRKKKKKKKEKKREKKREEFLHFCRRQETNPSFPQHGDRRARCSPAPVILVK